MTNPSDLEITSAIVEAGFQFPVRISTSDSDYNFIEMQKWYDCAVRLYKIAAIAERKACVKLLEDFSQTQMVPVVDTWRMGLVAGANAIRQRGRNEKESG
jgi:hypothetical protein